MPPPRESGRSAPTGATPPGFSPAPTRCPSSRRSRAGSRRSKLRPGNERTIRIFRLEDGAAVAELSVVGRRQNPGRSRWLPDGRTLVFYGDDESGRAALFQQPIVPGRDTRSERRRVAVSDEQRLIESFGVSPVDGRIVVSAGWGDSDILLAEGIPGIGATLAKRQP